MFGYTFYWSMVWSKLPDLMAGALTTLEVTLASMVLGTLLAIPMALSKRHGVGVAYRISSIWIEIARNTPTLLQLYVAYFGLGAIGLQISSYFAVLIGLSFNNAGYLAEIFRGGLAAVPRQQYAAARSLGMNSWRAYASIVLPQVFHIVFLPYVNQLNWALLNSSLGMVVGLRELTGATQAAQSESFRTFEFFIVAAGIYFVIAKLIATIALASKSIAMRG
jgi:His/Glu/Gln/Arg/opine family amino acid ABC transporter permease subunit